MKVHKTGKMRPEVISPFQRDPTVRSAGAGYRRRASMRCTCTICPQGDQISQFVSTARSARHDARFGLSRGLRTAAFVDSEGLAQEFHVVRGDRKKKSAALNAARHWCFQPCSGSAGCEHLLKFTDYGDASILRMID
jgi:hypothetical protein